MLSLRCSHAVHAAPTLRNAHGRCGTACSLFLSGRVSLSVWLRASFALQCRKLCLWALCAAPSLCLLLKELPLCRKPVAGEIIIFHPDKAIFGEPIQPSNPVLSAVFGNSVFKSIVAFAGLDDDVFIKRIVAVEGDTVEVMSAHAAALPASLAYHWPSQPHPVGSHAMNCPSRPPMLISDPSAAMFGHEHRVTSQHHPEQVHHGTAIAGDC